MQGAYTWRNGRELASMTDGATTWSYTYDANGMRTRRSGNNTLYEYVYNGGSLSQVIIDMWQILKFTYDANGIPMMVNYENEDYYYITNLQGDVVGIADSTGTVVVSYTYEAWGKPLSITGSMADTLGVRNPLRYRGYVYDQETGLYYLQSRYYDPEIGRFINADTLVSTGQGLLGNNMFAYCLNNPVNLKDPTGEAGLLVAFLVSTIIAGVSNAISTACSGGSVEQCLVSGLIGAGSAAVGFGIALATGFTPWGNIAARVVSSTICNLGTTWYRNGKITEQDVTLAMADVAMDSCFSAITYGYTEGMKDMVAQTLVNSTADAGVDILESALFGSQQQPGTSGSNTQKSGGYRVTSSLRGGIYASHVLYTF